LGVLGGAVGGALDGCNEGFHLDEKGNPQNPTIWSYIYPAPHAVRGIAEKGVGAAAHSLNKMVRSAAGRYQESIGPSFKVHTNSLDTYKSLIKEVPEADMNHDDKGHEILMIDSKLYVQKDSYDLTKLADMLEEKNNKNVIVKFKRTSLKDVFEKTSDSKLIKRKEKITCTEITVPKNFAKLTSNQKREASKELIVALAGGAVRTRKENPIVGKVVNVINKF
jgi:hypothetical protein